MAAVRAGLLLTLLCIATVSARSYIGRLSVQHTVLHQGKSRLYGNDLSKLTSRAPSGPGVTCRRANRGNIAARLQILQVVFS